MRLRSFCAAAAVGLLAFLAGVTPAAGQEIDEGFRADIVKLMDVTGAAKLGQQMATLMSGQVFEGFKRTRPDLPARAFDIAKEVCVAELERAISAPDGMLPRLVPIYAKYFTHDEVKGLLAFYQSELGRKTISVMPALVQEGARVGQEWAQSLLPHMEATLHERLKAEGFAK